MRIIWTTSQHRPFQTAITVASPICGILVLTLDVRPRSVQMAMPLPIQLGWEFGLIVVGVAGLLGVTWRGQLSTGLGIELASVLVLGTITSMYAVALFAISGKSGVVAATFIAAVAAGSWWRTGELTLDLRRLAELNRPANTRPVSGEHT